MWLNFYQFILQLLPPFLRDGNFHRLLDIFAYELKNVQMYISDNEVYTGQISSLEHLLNLKFNLNYDINIRDTLISNTEIIYIDEESIEPFYLWNENENFIPFVYFHNELELFPPIYWYNSMESIYEGSFIVYVPNWLIYDENYLRAIINKFKIAGKKYLIKSYT